MQAWAACPPGRLLPKLEGKIQDTEWYFHLNEGEQVLLHLPLMRIFERDASRSQFHRPHIASHSKLQKGNNVTFYPHQLIGDLVFCVALHNLSFWSNRQLFHLHNSPTCCEPLVGSCLCQREAEEQRTCCTQPLASVSISVNISVNTRSWDVWEADCPCEIRTTQFDKHQSTFLLLSVHKIARLSASQIKSWVALSSLVVRRR